MTIEEFAHRCLMIKAGNATLDIPCCANCKYYIFSKYDSLGWICLHPESHDYEDDWVGSYLSIKPEDFCSRWESRNEEKEVKEEN